jgi:hypothetical protein
LSRDKQQEAVKMSLQGRSRCSALIPGEVLDRLSGLREVIPPEAVRQALVLAGKREQRRCVLNHETMIWLMIAMGLLTDLPIRQVYKHSRRLRMHERTPGRSALCQARQRLGVAPLRQLFSAVVRPLAQPGTPGAFYRGLRLVGMDGTVLDVPDSELNARVFGYPDGGRGRGGFPQVRKLSLVELGTHVEFAVAFAPLSRGEPSLVESLLDRLPPDALLIQDRNFFSYHAWKRLNLRGVKGLARVKQALIFEPLRRLPDGSFLAKVYRSTYDRQRDRNGVVLRVIRYFLDDPQRTGHGELHVLVTNLWDETTHPAGELIAVYHERWEHEGTIDEQKTHQDPKRAEKPAHVRSETPAGVIQELYALSLAHFVVRALMFQAAAQAGLDPDRLSFTGCFQILQCRLPECDSRTPHACARWFAALLDELQRERTDPRRNRINPRVIKQKVKRWPKKRHHHRGPPPLTKTFTQTIVILR